MLGYLSMRLNKVGISLNTEWFYTQFGDDSQIECFRPSESYRDLSIHEANPAILWQRILSYLYHWKAHRFVDSSIFKHLFLCRRLSHGDVVFSLWWGLVLFLRWLDRMVFHPWLFVFECVLWPLFYLLGLLIIIYILTPPKFALLILSHIWLGGVRIYWDTNFLPLELMKAVNFSLDIRYHMKRKYIVCPIS